MVFPRWRVDILFARKLRKHMNSASMRQKKFGDLAKVIGRRLDDLAALESLVEAYDIPGRLEPLLEDRAGQFSLRLSGNWRIIIEPANDPMPTRDDGSIDPGKVTAIRVVAVEDYHKK